MSQKISQFLSRTVNIFLDPPRNSSETPESPVSTIPQFFHPTETPWTKESPVSNAAQRFGSRASLKNQNPSLTKIPLSVRDPALRSPSLQYNASPETWGSLLELHGAEIDALPLSPTHQAMLRDQLQSAFASKNPARIRHTLEELQVWKQYGFLKTKQILFHSFLSEAYPE